jgi:riboflavin biosynthesis pyrimidine reductase
MDPLWLAREFRPAVDRFGGMPKYSALMSELSPSERLERFIARKTREATGTTLPPLRTVFQARADALVEIGNEWSRRLFDGPFWLSPVPADAPGASLVFVQSKDGNTVASDPSSLGGGDADKHLIYEGLSRVAADAVMAGAETARGGNFIFSVWHPELVALRRRLGKPRHPVQIIATLRGLDLDRALLFAVPELRIVLITTGACASLMHAGLQSRPWIRSIVMERPEDLRDAFTSLRRDGIERVSVVGGRTVATQLLDADLIQDVYLTTSAKTGGAPNTPMYPRQLNGQLVLRKEGTGQDAGVVFEHIQLVT